MNTILRSSLIVLVVSACATTAYPQDYGGGYG
jgi:hypothetical protein